MIIDYIRVTVMPIVVRELGTIPKDLERRQEELKIRGRIETIKTTALLKSFWVFRRVMDSRNDWRSLRFQ